MLLSPFTKLLTLVFIIFFCLGFQSKAQHKGQQLHQKLHTNWKFKAVNDSTWLRAEVPGSIHTDLISNGIIEDPFYRLNEKDLQWIDKKDWEYQTVFQISNTILKKEKIFLNFKGLDTHATIYLNDTLLLTTDNMFMAWNVDCKAFLKTGANKLKILFESPIKKGLKARENLGYGLPNAVNDQSENGGLGKKQVAVFNRKAGYHFGWDWGPRLVTSGIWKEIELTAWNYAQITDSYYRQEIVKDQALINLKVEIEATSNFKSTLSIKVDSILSKTIEIALTKGKNTIEIPFKINKPKLWWTNGLGNQKLYKIALELQKENNLIDSDSKNIGIKTLKVIQKKDSIGESFYFELNGHAVFMKGANYIPQDVFLNRVTPKDYKKMVLNMVEANYNMIRVWGGGIYEKELFYDLCDEYGILVWQDFMFACAMYPGDKDFLENVKQEAEYNVKRLRNHTSIALWCGNNENLVAWKNWGWMEQIKKEQGTQIIDTVYKAYKNVFHEILPKVVDQLSVNTFYWASSPTSARGEDATLTSGDYHYWGVWGQGETFSTFDEYIPRFMSEYGFQSFPEFESVKKYTEKEDWSIYSEVMKSHQRSAIGNKSIERYMQSWYKKPKNFESFLYVSQLLQAKGMKIAIEAHRRNMPYCMGSLYWQINDCWPVASWSSIDYYGNWKASHYKVKDLYKPIKLSFYKKNDQIEVHIVSDKLDNKQANLNLKVMDFNGKRIKSFHKEITITSNTSTIYQNIDYLNFIKKKKLKKVFIVAELSDLQNNIFDESLFFFEAPKNLKLKKPKITIKISKGLNDHFNIEVSSKTLAKNIRLQTLIDGHFSTNYFDLVPLKNKIIRFKPEQKTTVENLKKSIKLTSLYNTYNN